MDDIIRTVAVDPDEAAFADLVVADEEWLRAEFDAIVAAEEWGEPSPPKSSSPVAGHPGEPDRASTPDDRGAVQPVAKGTSLRPRAAERSPPGPVTSG